MATMVSLVVIVGSYLIGNILTGPLVARYRTGVDLRQVGSKNVGATNVARSLGLRLGFLVLVLDALKGFIPVLGAKLLQQSDLVIVIAGIAVVVGHDWPIFARFHGGKGVATSLGVLLAISPKVAITLTLIWLVVVYFTRYVSLGSLMAGVSLPLVMLLFGMERVYVIGGVIMAIMATVRHRSNIQRLVGGSELKIGQRK
ncbi:MAG: glycerol-3-phosphate 1-O-acyltransferase PlsY [Limnochordia bacterium]|nr:glycerol-3-phosphate 1-O-acyltransferase PlsY [Limnochordia bacterium]MDD4518149.1 glycerol-3-phosphate 1-O-acyltransferase PlsY [Limnochordia bacterium]